ncbi:hypothetical protein OH76DRAFT_1146593 [Lentinus brumalis]|uniref:Uncharacterized protein n=1 Tax=Lentinus brumalis TaxID=2498619 RepID=A0A371DML9_9APHY|nr:hypothetical protein OH76DRAFT_1146593 [Polyporus brumalis]
MTTQGSTDQETEVHASGTNGPHPRRFLLKFDWARVTTFEVNTRGCREGGHPEPCRHQQGPWRTHRRLCLGERTYRAHVWSCVWLRTGRVPLYNHTETTASALSNGVVPFHAPIRYLHVSGRRMPRVTAGCNACLSCSRYEPFIDTLSRRFLTV